MYTGEQTLEWLFDEQLQIDEEWAESTPQGFRWWADKHAQTIEVIGDEEGPDGNKGYFVNVRTEMLRSFDLNERAANAINALIMPFASMAGPVYERELGLLSLCSLVRVHEVIAHWMNPLISLAAVMQIAEVRRIGPELAKLLGAKEAISGHPENGLRREPDELPDSVDTVIVPFGSQPSRWEADEFEYAVRHYMQQPPVLDASAGGPGFTVEFPYGDFTSLCQARADEKHPRYGNGLLVLQSFPLRQVSELDGITLALWFNALALTERPLGYGFGSYSYRDGLLTFNSFWPNVAYQPGLLANIFFSCAERAHEMSVRLTGTEWSPDSVRRSRGALGRLMDRFLGG